MTPFGLTRAVIYPLVFVFALAVVGCAGQILSWDGAIAYLDTYAAFAVAVGVFTFLLLPVVVVVDRLRTNFFLSWASVEIGWLGFFWLMWLTCAGLASGSVAGVLGSCDGRSAFVNNYWSNVGDVTGAQAMTACHLAGAIIGLSWLNWLLVSTVWIWLLIIAINANNAGYRKIWTTSAADYNPTLYAAPPLQQSAYPMGHSGYTYQQGPPGSGPMNPSYGNGPFPAPMQTTQYGYPQQTGNPGGPGGMY